MILDESAQQISKLLNTYATVREDIVRYAIYRNHFCILHISMMVYALAHADVTDYLSIGLQYVAGASFFWMLTDIAIRQSKESARFLEREIKRALKGVET